MITRNTSAASLPRGCTLSCVAHACIHVCVKGGHCKHIVHTHSHTHTYTHTYTHTHTHTHKRTHTHTRTHIHARSHNKQTHTHTYTHTRTHTQSKYIHTQTLFAKHCLPVQENFSHLYLVQAQVLANRSARLKLLTCSYPHL